MFLRHFLRWNRVYFFLDEHFVGWPNGVDKREWFAMEKRSSTFQLNVWSQGIEQELIRTSIFVCSQHPFIEVHLLVLSESDAREQMSIAKAIIYMSIFMNLISV